MIEISITIDKTVERYVNTSLIPSGLDNIEDVHKNRCINDPPLDSNKRIKKLKAVITEVLKLSQPSLKDYFIIGNGESVSVLTARLSPYYHDPKMLKVVSGKVAILLPSDSEAKRDVICNHILRSFLMKYQAYEMVGWDDLIYFTVSMVRGKDLPNMPTYKTIAISDDEIENLASYISDNQKINIELPALSVSDEYVKRFMIQHDLLDDDQIKKIMSTEHKSYVYSNIVKETPNLLVATACVLLTDDTYQGISAIVKMTGYIYVASLGYDMLFRDYSIFTQSNHRWMASVFISLGIYALNKGSITVGIISILVGLLTMSLFENQLNLIFDTISDVITRFLPWK